MVCFSFQNGVSQLHSTRDCIPCLLLSFFQFAKNTIPYLSFCKGWSGCGGLQTCPAEIPVAKDGGYWHLKGLGVSFVMDLHPIFYLAGTGSRMEATTKV